MAASTSCNDTGYIEGLGFEESDEVGLVIKRVGIIGLGPHNRRIYYPQLERRGIAVAIVVDLAGQKPAIDEYLHGRKLQPETFAWVADEHRDSPTVHDDISAALLSVKMDGLIISSEPLAHQPYLRWALENNIDVLIDKPPIIPSPFSLTPEAARQIITDFDEVLSLACTSKANATVTVQRRAHPGYCFVHKLLTDVVKEWQVPISYIDIYHADGMWCMPGEMCTRSYHPYKHGYGKLMHSGYHFLDLLMWLHTINEANCPEKAGEQFELYCRKFGAQDLLAQNGANDLRRLTKASEGDVLEDMARIPEALFNDLTAVGEQNFHALLQFFKDETVSCTASVNLMQNTFSRRSWFTPKKDLYKGNGRVRHERLVIQVGTLLTLHVHSYQSHEVNSVDPPAPSNGTSSTRTLLRQCGLDPDKVPGFNTVEYGHGHDEHFDVVVYRNTAVIGGAAVETIPIGLMVSSMEAGRAGYLGHNEHGRERILVDWLCGIPEGGLSPLHRQRPTMHLLSRMYEMLALNRESVKELKDIEDEEEDDLPVTEAETSEPHDEMSQRHSASQEMPASFASRYQLHREISKVVPQDFSPRKQGRRAARVQRSLSMKVRHWDAISFEAARNETFPKQDMKAIVFLGGPGSGKGTQANLLKGRLSFAHLDFGQTVRSAIKHGTSVGKRIEASGEYGPGKFLGPELVLEVMREAAARQCALGTQCVILDGCPRNVQQAERMKSISLDVQLAVLLEAPEDVLFPRVDGRLIHAASGRTYHPKFRPPHVAMQDDITGEPLQERKLDKTKPNSEAFRARMDVEFNGNVVPLIDWYEGRGFLVRINAAEDLEKVYAAILVALKEKGLYST